MNRHLEEDAELFALGVLDEDERARVEAHAAACAQCAQRLGEAEAVIAELALAEHEAQRSTPPRTVRVRRAGPLALAAAFALALGITVASLVHAQRVAERTGADDAILATIATSHFNHAQFAKVQRDAPAAKLLNARHGEWLYVILASPAGDIHVVADRGGTTVDLGPARVHGQTSTLFVRDPGLLARVELERNGSVIETAIPSYKDE